MIQLGEKASQGGECCIAAIQFEVFVQIVIDPQSTVGYRGKNEFLGHLFSKNGLDGILLDDIGRWLLDGIAGSILR